jgi:hypothetical protein
MQKPYIVIDDTGFNHKHGRQFETVESAEAYIQKHDLQCTHLIYDLSKAPTVLPEYTLG